MQALGKRVVVREDVVPEKIGSIYIPYQGKPQLNTLSHTGIVVSVGKDVNPEIKVGLRVLFSRLAPMQVLENEKLLVMKEDDVQGIIEE